MKETAPGLLWAQIEGIEAGSVSEAAEQKESKSQSGTDSGALFQATVRWRRQGTLFPNIKAITTIRMRLWELREPK
jgi:hypothetical protein